MSVGEASQAFGVHRNTVRKMLANATPQGYTWKRPPRRPKLEPYTSVIGAILEADQRVPRKQHHTVKRIFERLLDEYGYEGQHTIVKDYVGERRGRTGEMFVPLTHGPGHAQRDFGEAVAVIAWVERKVHYFVLDLPHGDGCFVKGYPAETTEAFLDGHMWAFAFLGGSPQSILYDNTKLAAAKILDDGRRKHTWALRPALSCTYPVARLSSAQVVDSCPNPAVLIDCAGLDCANVQHPGRITCKGCHAAIPVNARFCPECGQATVYGKESERFDAGGFRVVAAKVSRTYNEYGQILQKIMSTTSPGTDQWT